MTRAELELRYGKIWTTDEMVAEFETIGFLAPYVVVKRRGDGVKGSLMFQHYPRFYFEFTVDEPDPRDEFPPDDTSPECLYDRRGGR